MKALPEDRRPLSCEFSQNWEGGDSQFAQIENPDFSPNCNLFDCLLLFCHVWVI